MTTRLNLTAVWVSDEKHNRLVAEYANKSKALLFYWYSPDRLIFKHNAKPVRLPPHNRVQWATANREDCCSASSTISSGWALEPLYKMTSKRLQNEAPVLTSLLRNLYLSEEQIQDMIHMLPEGRFRPALVLSDSTLCVLQPFKAQPTCAADRMRLAKR